jgi:hypothetical protein
MVSQMFRRISCFKIRKVHLAYPAVIMAAGSVLVPATSQARDIVPSIRPIVALKEPAVGLDSFILLLESSGQAGSEERNAFKHHFFEQKTADAGVPPPPAAGPGAPSASPAVPAQESQDSAPEASTDTSNSAAKPDPNFDRWQKDANERLKEENSIKEPLPHPLAAANPGKSVVVCEAGCGTLKDEIVYIADIVRAETPEKKFEPNSAIPDDGSAPCIAGCYEREEPKRPAPRTHAQITRPVRVVVAAPAKDVSHDVTDAIMPEKIAPEKTANKGGPQASAKSRHIQTARNGAIVEGRRLSRAANLLRNAHIKSSAVYRKKPIGSWHVRVTHGETQPLRRRSLSRLGHRTAHSHGWKTYIHIGSN